MKEFVSSTIDIDDAFQALNLNNIDSEKLTNMAASLADKFIRVHNNFYLPHNGPHNAKKRPQDEKRDIWPIREPSPPKTK